MSANGKDACPSPKSLAQLATGSLNEQQADRLFRHLEHCVDCQRAVDRAARHADAFQVVAKDDIPESDGDTTEPPNVSKLIRRAQQIRGSDTANGATRPLSSQTVSIEDFVKGFRRSGLLPDDEVEACLNEIDGDSDSDDSASLAKMLIRRKKLTPFQARFLLLGRGKALVLGNYAILDRLGRGGMGNVFLAKHLRMGRTVCLKVINSAGRQSKTAIERFRNEARALAALSHPNIVVAHDADENKGLPFLVMEHIPGSDLSKCVKQDGPLSVRQALRVARQTARALDYAHSQGVIHRDVKPNNLLLTEDAKTGEMLVKILDLGLAKFDTLLTENPDASLIAAMTNTGVVIGTVDYMSPEQALDGRLADARSDIYSLGCTLHYLLTGLPPYDGETTMQRLVAHREQPVPIVSQIRSAVPTEVDFVIARMMAKVPENRYQSMSEVAADLEALLAGRSPRGVTVPPALLEIRIDKEPRIATTNWFMATTTACAVIFACTICALLARVGLGTPSYERVATNAEASAALVGSSRLRPTFRRSLDESDPPSRALIVVSSVEFDDGEYSALVRELRRHNLIPVTTSPGIHANSKDALRSQTENIPIAEFEPDTFEAVFFVSGKNHELLHKSPTNHHRIRQLVETSMNRGLVVSAIGTGWEVLVDTGYCPSCELQQQGQLRYVVDDRNGAIILRAKNEAAAAELVARAVEHIQTRDTLPPSGAASEVLTEVEIPLLDSAGTFDPLPPDANLTSPQDKPQAEPARSGDDVSGRVEHIYHVDTTLSLTGPAENSFLPSLVYCRTGLHSRRSAHS